MFYIIIMTLAVFVTLFINDKNDTKNSLMNKVLIFISFFIVLLPHALRYGIGTDYFYTYVPGFLTTGSGGEFYDEIGFVLLNKYIYILTKDYRVLFFVCSVIIFFFLYRGIIKNSKSIPLSILLIFLTQCYFYSMNLMRQAIAIAIIFYAFKYIKDNKKIKYIICCLIASLMHSSAMMMIPFVFLYNIELGKLKKIVICLFIFIFSGIVGKIIYYIANTYTSYGWYYDSVYAAETVPTTLILTNLMLFIINILFYPTKKEEDKEYKILSNINFIGMCFIIISPSIPLIYRIVKYFTIFQILLIPEIFLRIKEAKLRFGIELVVIGFMFITMVYQIMVLGGEAVYPYVSIFN